MEHSEIFKGTKHQHESINTKLLLKGHNTPILSIPLAIYTPCFANTGCKTNLAWTLLPYCYPVPFAPCLRPLHRNLQSKWRKLCQLSRQWHWRNSHMSSAGVFRHACWRYTSCWRYTCMHGWIYVKKKPPWK